MFVGLFEMLEDITSEAGFFPAAVPAFPVRSLGGCLSLGMATNPELSSLTEQMLMNVDGLYLLGTEGN